MGCASRLSPGRPFGFIRVLRFKQWKSILTDLVAKKVANSQNHYEVWEPNSELWGQEQYQKPCCRNKHSEEAAITDAVSILDSAPFFYHHRCPGNLIWPQLHCCKRTDCYLCFLVFLVLYSRLHRCFWLAKCRLCTWIQVAKADGKVLDNFCQFLGSENGGFTSHFLPRSKHHGIL